MNVELKINHIRESVNIQFTSVKDSKESWGIRNFELLYNPELPYVAKPDGFYAAFY